MSMRVELGDVIREFRSSPHLAATILRFTAFLDYGKNLFPAWNCEKIVILALFSPILSAREHAG